MATINDVATKAGVSVKTVSRVLNNEPHVRPVLRDRVEEAIRALEYSPNQAARRLAGSRSFLIGYLCQTPNDPYVASIQAGAVKRCHELGHYLVVESVDAHPQADIASAEKLIRALKPDGIILLPPLSDNAELVAALDRSGTPMVCIAAAARESGVHIFSDDHGAGRAVTEYLISLGHSAVGVVRGHPEHHSAMKRFDGYLEAMHAAGLRVEPHFVGQGYFDLQSGIAAAQAMLAHPNRPTAIFASNDEMALGVLFAAREFGIDVPGQLSVVGFDDSPISRLIWPALTTVSQPLSELGALAADLLIQRPSRVGEHKLPFELKVRASTGRFTQSTDA